jgi:transposase
MKTKTQFRPYAPNQPFLLPPDMKEWLREDDLVYFVMDVVGQLDLAPICRTYRNEKGGQPPYHPEMMTSLLIYAYCIGLPSSRKIEQATYQSVAFRVLTADQHPDHDTIAEFRRRHLKALAGFFVEVLRLCRKAGLVKLGHVALDGTKMAANASKHKAMSYARMEKSAAELRAEVERLLAEAQATDAAEDALYGKGRRGEELPPDLRFKQSRLKKIEEAKKALEEEARAEAEAKQAAYEAKCEAWGNRTERRGGRPPKPPSEKPVPSAQRNFTDPDSRIMPIGRGKSFVQGYNCQAAVDEKAQIIVATNVTQETNDKQQLKPVLEKLKANTDGQTPQKISADSGYYSQANVTTLEADGIQAFIPPEQNPRGETAPLHPRGRIPKGATVKERMVRKLRTVKGRCTYSKRKGIAEPVFGQIKEVRGFRRFSFRGFHKVAPEWDLICLTHNILKLFRSGWRLQMA